MLRYRPVWKHGEYLADPREAVVLHKAGLGAHFGGVNWAYSGFGSSVAFACENGTVPGKLWLTLPEKERGAKLVQLGRETAHHDVRKPVGSLLSDASRALLVFHEASQMRFFGDPEKRESIIFSVEFDPSSY